MNGKESKPGRHEKFQLGTNPMKMTEFEKSRVELERLERLNARSKYIKGMQGRDGGATAHEGSMRDADLPIQEEEV